MTLIQNLTDSQLFHYLILSNNWVAIPSGYNFNELVKECETRYPGFLKIVEDKYSDPSYDLTESECFVVKNLLAS